MFKVKDIGELKYFVGLEVARSHNGIHICQRKYTLDILVDIGLLVAKHISTPMIKDTNSFFNKNATLYDTVAYQRIIRRPLY